MTPIAQRGRSGEMANIFFKAHTIYEVIYHLQVNGDKLKMYTINSEPPLKKRGIEKSIKKNPQSK